MQDLSICDKPVGCDCSSYFAPEIARCDTQKVLLKTTPATLQKGTLCKKLQAGKAVLPSTAAGGVLAEAIRTTPAGDRHQHDRTAAVRMSDCTFEGLAAVERFACRGNLPNLFSSGIISYCMLHTEMDNSLA